MSVWDRLGKAATVAGLTGIDAAGVIATMRGAARTAHQKYKDGENLERHLKMLEYVLQEQEEHNSLATQQWTRFEEKLTEARKLMELCEGQGGMYWYINGSRLAKRLRAVEKKINNIYLSSGSVAEETMLERAVHENAWEDQQYEQPQYDPEPYPEAEYFGARS